MLIFSVSTSLLCHKGGFGDSMQAYQNSSLCVYHSHSAVSVLAVLSSSEVKGEEVRFSLFY